MVSKDFYHLGAASKMEVADLVGGVMVYRVCSGVEGFL